LAEELSTNEIKGILDQIHAEGCLEVTFSGGEPLLREDFLDIYLYAKRKGFLIDIFSNGILFTGEKIEFFQKCPPRSIEITLDGISKDTYEAITQAEGSFDRVMSNIVEMSRRNLPLVLKASCLKQNKREIAKIKAFTAEIFGRDKKRFKFDQYICPRLNKDKTPCKHRLSPCELKEVIESDSEIYAEAEQGLKSEYGLTRGKEFLYHCNTWLTHFFVNPFGRLKFCLFTEDFSMDLKKGSFKEGFYNLFPQLLKAKFESNSECKDCKLRPHCFHCPARAHLETGDRESPVPYFCELAKAYLKYKGNQKNRR